MTSLEHPARPSKDDRHDAQRAKTDFPILSQSVHGKPLVFLDSAASAQKPRAVIEAIKTFYESDYANIHRGVYQLSMRATEAFESARERVRAFLNAGQAREIIFVRGATEGINLVAQSFGRANLEKGDEIILSEMEHHSNIVPWQMLRDEKGVVLKVVPIDDSGALDMDAYRALLGERTRLVAMTHTSNALGTITPIKEIIDLAHQQEVPVLVDGCQAVPHQPVDVTDLDCDFYVFSGHKLYGPSGIGVLYGKAGLLEAMPPYQGGGEMIASVTFEKTDYHVIPHKFEAGTPHIAGAVGLAAAIDYVETLGLARISAHEAALLEEAESRLAEIPGLCLVGTAPQKAGIISFTLEGVHPHDIGTILDQFGIAVRAGHHCAQPVMERYGIPATVRASFGLYNVAEDITALVEALHETRRVFA